MWAEGRGAADDDVVDVEDFWKGAGDLTERLR